MDEKSRMSDDDTPPEGLEPETDDDAEMFETEDDPQHLILQGRVLGHQQVKLGDVLGGVFGHVVGIGVGAVPRRFIAHRFSLIRP